MEGEPNKTFCFTGIVGQEDMKTALLLTVINRNLGGVLIRGEKGTAKSTAVRALAELLPLRAQVEGCRFGCDPDDEAHLCEECRSRLAQGLKRVYRKMEVIDLPVSATEDRVVGTLDMEHAISAGEKRFETGILARANRNILYVDEVNLLDDHVVDILLDSAAMGVNTVEREGVSYSHPARFILVGTMNPEEGDLRPQLLDRFGLSVTVRGERDVEQRMRVLESRLRYENDPDGFFRDAEPEQRELRDRIIRAEKLLAEVRYSRDILETIARIGIALEVDGHRADITMLKAAMTLAALNGRTDTRESDVLAAAKFALPHRMRRLPFEDAVFDPAQIEALIRGIPGDRP
jgi:magnesium chelatase subunit I